MRVDFYHLQSSPVENAVFMLASKVYGIKKNLLIRTDVPERADSLNEQLWTLAPDSWLPHGSVRNDFADRQPVYLTAGYENPNKASVLMLINTTDAADINAFERVLFVFDGNDENVLANARAFWKSVAAAEDGEAHYWAQNDRGAWEERAKSGRKTADS